jgi:hypothetical protein|tara:strand:+ start:343 stop:645 length:303 start_codon:yes stop_codon:yes gene_type:complete
MNEGLLTDKIAHAIRNIKFVPACNPSTGYHFGVNTNQENPATTITHSTWFVIAKIAAVTKRKANCDINSSLNAYTYSNQKAVLMFKDNKFIYLIRTLGSI